jgi:AAHS family 4-hydroxybenzoate transporter-like MFS transporter
MAQLLIFRLLTGVGLGGAMPNFISLASEYAPQRRRKAVVALLWTGFPLGGVVVGLLASGLIDAAGWPSLFYFGGSLALALAAVLLPALPESIGFLVRQRAPSPEIRKLLRRVFPHVTVGPEALVVPDKNRRPVATVRCLFADGRWFGTLALWVCCFVTFLLLVTDTAWTPILLREAGLGGAPASFVLAVFSFGSVIGTPLAGLLIGRWPAHKVLPASLVGSALALGELGYGDASLHLVSALQGVAGLCLGIASSGLIASAAVFYAEATRSTGVGWAMGFGRLGSFVGPLALGLLVSLGWQPSSAFAALGVAALCAGLAATTINAGTAETESTKREALRRL